MPAQRPYLPSEEEDEEVELVINPRKDPTLGNGHGISEIEEEEEILVSSVRGGSTVMKHGSGHGRRPFAGLSARSCTIVFAVAALLAVALVLIFSPNSSQTPATSNVGSGIGDETESRVGGGSWASEGGGRDNVPGEDNATDAPADEGSSSSEGQEGGPTADGGETGGGSSMAGGGGGWEERKRCPVMTFFNNRAVTEAMEDEEKLVTAWQLSWYSRGWQPVVLELRHARRHPAYKELVQQTGEGGVQAFAPWLAAAQHSGGLFVDYSVMNLAYPAPDTCHGMHQSLVVFQDFFPLVVEASMTSFAQLARAAASHSPQPLSLSLSQLQTAGLQVQQGAPLIGLQAVDERSREETFAPEMRQSPRWVLATSLMCSHFARQGPVLAFSSPTIPSLSSPLSRLAEAVSSCEAATLPAFQPPSFGPQGMIFTIIPPYISGLIAAVYIRAHIDPSSAPEWLKTSIAVRDLPQLSANEFGHFVVMHLMTLAPGDSDPDFSNVISTNLSRTLGVPLGSLEAEVLQRLTPSSSQLKVVFGFLDIPPESMKVLQLTLGFLLPADVVEAVERAMSEAWQSMRSLVGIMNSELRETMDAHNVYDVKLMTAAEKWLEKELQSVKDLDI